MANIAIAPIILNDIVLQFGADNYEAHVAKARLVPTVPQALWKGMTPAAIKPLVGTPVWALELLYGQDWVTAGALSDYLMTNIGQTKTVILKPKKPTTTGPTFTINVVCLPGPIGGELNTVATGDVSLPCEGQPVKTTA